MLVWPLSLTVCNKTCFQKITNPYVGVLSDAELTRRIAQQLKIEAADKVTVQSVVPKPKLTPVITAAVSTFIESSAVAVSCHIFHCLNPFNASYFKLLLFEGSSAIPV